MWICRTKNLSEEVCYTIKKRKRFYPRIYKIIYTKECINEMQEIYNYISINLRARSQADKLFTEIRQRIIELSIFPKMYAIIAKHDKADRIYHRMVVKNYIVLYTIDYIRHKVYISHIFYQRRNYLNLI